MISAVEKLMQGHGVLRRILLVYEEVLRAMSPPEAPGEGESGPAVVELIGGLVETTTLLQSYVQGYHERMEESYVFPRVEKFYKGAGAAALVVTLRRQHVIAGRLSVDVLVAARMADLKKLHERLGSLVTLYHAHTTWEDTDLMSAFRQTLTRDLSNELAEKFCTIERRLFGSDAEAHILSQISNVEHRFGIYSPAEFEP